MVTFSHATEPEIPVRVDLGPRSYEVRVVSGRTDAFGALCAARLDATWAGRACRRALLITDENVTRYEAPCSAALAAVGITGTVSVLPSGEPTKSLDRAADLYDDLVRFRADRHTCIVALGGGVLGDLAGFVAATYLRGLPLLMVPTTLLAQVDSSVGGKVGVNHPRAKNIIGAFHQPVGVWIDTETLATLPDRELRCGLAEVIKYGVILDAHFFKDLEENADAILARDQGCLRHIVAHSCRLKADVVTRDEREETGLRVELNFGHTIGHAVEAVAGYGDVPSRRGGRHWHGRRVPPGRAARLDPRRGVRPGPAAHRAIRPSGRLQRPRPRRLARSHGPRQEEPEGQDSVHPAPRASARSS